MILILLVKQQNKNMNFKSAELNEGFIFREVSENGLIEIGIYPVMYGFRVKAGFTKNDYYHIDWCCGNDQFFIERIYSILKDILSKREENYYCFKNILTHSEIKPLFNDKYFLKWLSRHIPVNLKEETLPDLHILKDKYMNDVFDGNIFPFK